MVSEGLVLATFAALPVLLRLIPGTGTGGSTTIGGLAAVPFLEHVGVNSTVLGFAAVLCVLTGIVAALWPRRASPGAKRCPRHSKMGVGAAPPAGAQDDCAVSW